MKNTQIKSIESIMPTTSIRLITFIIFGIFLSACNQKNSEVKFVTDKKLSNPIKSQSQNQSQKEEITNTEKLDEYKMNGVKNIIDLFKLKNIDKISSKISFPLHREYPIPSIKNKEEFKQRFNEVFDNVLIEKIVNSKIQQWSEVGWRGIMLDNGDVWMANSDGMITAVNYQSDFEKKLRQNLIAKDKQNLYASLKQFESPIYKIETSQHLIRIDKLPNSNYRYASWEKGEKETSKPNIILENGELTFQGSSANHIITFINGKYIYKIYRNIIGEKNSPEITLEIEKDGKIILTQTGRLIIA